MVYDHLNLLMYSNIMLWVRRTINRSSKDMFEEHLSSLGGNHFAPIWTIGQRKTFQTLLAE